MQILLLIVAALAWLFHDPKTPFPYSGVEPPSQASGPAGSEGIIGAEDRKLLSEFTLPGAKDAAAVRTSLAATQRLTCGASASLIYRPDVIVFSAHQLLADGKPDPDLKHCFFMVARTVDGKTTEEPFPLLLATLDHGVLNDMRVTNDDAGNADNTRDWSVVRLARPVKGIEPYRLPDENVPGPPGSAVVTASDTTENWKGRSDPPDRLAQTCHVVDSLPGQLERFPAVMHLDCDVGRGASGGAILLGVGSGTPVYAGTTIAYSGDECTEAELDTCFSIGRRLDHDLAARIRGTSLLGTGPEAEVDRAAQRSRLAKDRDGVAAAAAAALAAPFPAKDDPVGHYVAALDARIARLNKSPHSAEPLFLDAYQSLHDPDQKRPEWLRLWIANGEILMRQGRAADAYVCFKAAYALADDTLKPYLDLRLAQTALNADERSDRLREAYLAGGDGLFRLAGAGSELARITSTGLPTTPEP